MLLLKDCPVRTDWLGVLLSVIFLVVGRYFKASSVTPSFLDVNRCLDTPSCSDIDGCKQMVFDRSWLRSLLLFRHCL
jgi:hypothetical protein